MAIYSLHHSHVGRRTQKQPGTAGAHVRYITRAGAARLVMGEHMPTGRDQARAWIDEQEVTGRKDGRVIDKLMVALPLELDGQQRADLVREFVTEIGGGRVSWLAAVHDRGKDEHNPHAHIILRDKDHETGKRVFGTSGRGSTDRLREIWETVANRVLERDGQESRIDRRSLVDQAIAREAGIHVGPNVQAMEERGIRPESIAQDHTTSRGNERVVDWPEIDQGRTRADRQREIEAMNRDREADRGKQKGEQQAELAPATPAVELVQQPASDLDEVAAILRSLDERARDISGLITTPEPQREAQAQGLDLGGIDVAGQAREATQRASYEVEQKPEPVQSLEKEALDPLAERRAWAERLRGFDAQERERSRLAQIIAAGRERLAAMADRLEQAFQAYRDRQQIHQAEKRPQDLRPENPSAAERDTGRSLWDDWSQGRERKPKGPGW